MNGDFTRDTFRPVRHYQQVLRQQGRVGLDADHNEQSAIDLRRCESAALDLMGDCGGPADRAAFRIVTAPASLSDADYAALRKWAADQVALNPQPLPPTPALPASKASAVLGEGDFILMPGRYYVDGIQCELERPVLYRLQPDRLDVAALAKGAADLDYAVYLDVWRRHLTAIEDEGIRDPALGGVDTATRAQTVWQVRTVPLTAIAASPCASGTVPPAADADPGTARLTAFTADPVPDKDPCLLPPEAGYTGLENQLYRVEVHDATQWKWSRENGSVTAVIQQLIATEAGKPGGAVIVDSLGRDENLAFHENDYVEILDDSFDLEAKPAQLLRIVRVDPGARKLELEAAVTLLATGASFPNGIHPVRHPKVRRWEGQGRIADADTTAGAPLEHGIRVRFEKKDELGATCVFKARHFWLIPARAATASSPRGDIEWPLDLTNKRVPQPPRGVVHHHCRLAVVRVAPSGAVQVLNDCRCLWPALTSIPRLFYASGDGQEATVSPVAPATAASRYVLPRPLVVMVANGHCSDHTRQVRFETILGTGQVARVGQAPAAASIDVDVAPDGTAAAEFYPDAVNFSQGVQARLLDAFGVPVGPPIQFNATLTSVSLVAVGGDGQDASPGAPLALPLEVVVLGATGPIAGAQVAFTPSAGSVTAAPPTNALGRTQVTWTLGTSPDTQQVVATLTALPSGATPRGATEVRFTANLRRAISGGASCCVVVGPTGAFPGLFELFENDEIRRLTDLCICLQAGDHVLNTSLEISPRAGTPYHVTLHGCGAPTRLLLREAPMRIEGVTTFALRDLEIDTGFISNPIQFSKTERVLIDGCRIHTEVLATDLVTVTGAEELEIRDSQFEVWFDAPDVAPIPGIDLGPLGRAASPSLLTQRIRALADRAVELGADGLRPFFDYWRRDEILSRVRGNALLDRYKIAVDTLARASATGAFADFRRLLPLMTFGRALVVTEAMQEISLISSQFLGDLHFLGNGPAATEDEMIRLVTSSRDGFEFAKRLQRPLGAWQILHCDALQLTLARSSLPDALDDLILRHPERLQLAGNTWRTGFVPVVAGQTDLSHHHFLSESSPLAIGGGDVATVVGNSTPFFERSILARYGSLEAGFNARIGVSG